MKPLLLFISIVVFSPFYNNCLAQADRDSAAARSIRVMQTALALADSQVIAIGSIMRIQNRQLDALQQNNSLEINDRAKELVKIQYQYKQKLKSILNNAQWKEYKEMEAVHRDGVLNRMKDSKAAVKELPRDGN